MSLVLSYNDLDLSPVLKNNKEDKGNDEDEDDPEDYEEERHHESTFTKQLLYFLLMTCLNMGYGLTLTMMFYET